MKKCIIVLLLVSFVVSSCKNRTSKESTDVPIEASVESTENTKSEWSYLFNGESTDGWRSFNGKELPDGWVLEGETLKSLGKGGDIGGDIIYGKEQFSEFELVLEWKISEAGNSGIFYHVIEGEQYDAPYMNAPEYQLIDQVGFPQKLEPWQSIGADYGMYDPNYKGALKNVGEWNSSRILFNREKCEYWLNGQQTLVFEPWSEDWVSRKNKGKWKDYPDYGMAKTGYIGLQDHGSFIWFKNIKIRRISEE